MKILNEIIPTQDILRNKIYGSIYKCKKTKLGGTLH